MSESPARLFAIDVVRRLCEAGHQALWAGGCVRDLMRGSEPTDYDVATSALPQQVRDLFGRKNTHAVGLSFGVIIVRAPKPFGGNVEVATFRTDASYSDGRRPDSVSFSTPREDALRRDFTINGMFYDPFRDQVIDYVGGRADLAAGIVRAIGNAADRLAEDKLRMLRAVRFAARFGFSIELQTRDAIAASAQEVGIVSGERIATEVQQTLITNSAAWALQEWAELGLLDVILPEVAASWMRSGSTACQLLAVMQGGSWQAKLSAVLYACHVISRGQISDLRARLKLSNVDTESIQFALASQSDLETAPHRPWSQVQPIVVSPSLPFALELLEARCQVGLDDHCLEWIKERIETTPDLNPSPLLVGRDLIELGMKPGPRFKLLLAKARDMQLDGKLYDRQQALQWIAKQWADA